MRWSLKLVLHRLQANVKVNITLVLQIALGTALFFASLSIYESCIIQQQHNRDSMTNLAVTISENGGNETGKITISDYQAIKNSLANAPCEVIYSIETGIYAQEQRISVLFVSSNYGSWMAGQDELGQTYAMGQKAAERLINNVPCISATAEMYDAEHQLLFGYPLKSYQVLNFDSISKTARGQQVSIQSDTDYSYANTVFVPLDALSANWSEYGTTYIYLVPHDHAASQMDTFCKQAINTLSTVHPSLHVMYQNDYLALQSQANELIRNAELFKTIALVMLIILSFEIIGHFMLIVFRRQKTYAISRMCGAKTIQLLLELFLEVGGIAFMGAIVGLIPTIAILPQFGNGLYIPHGTVGAALGVFAVLVNLSLMVILFCVPAIGAASPISVLHNSNE